MVSYKGIPPGTAKIEDNLYYDKFEVANVHWREYMYWVGRVFGEKSKEYIAAIPDTMVWVKKDTCLVNYSEYYLRNPQYNYHPLVGVSQKQAEAYCKWRSDRVYEAILVDRKIIKDDRNQNAQNHFTIERYFAGEYQGVKPDSNFLYYPSYRLPTIEEWKTAVHFEDSMEHKVKAKVLFQNKDIEPCSKKNSSSVTRSYKDQYPLDDIDNGIFEKKHPLINLRGNVNEWTSEKGVCIGGGWADKANILATQDTFQIEGVNAWTGFRSVCEWKEYKIK
jgi:formylglycine-generating enzyme required for sulfatase activity